MNLLRPRKAAFTTLFLLIAMLISSAGEVHAQGSRPLNVVTYQTEDGMTIYGTLYLPAKTSQPAAGVILFAEPGWVVRTTLEQYGRVLSEKYGMAALTVDYRGNGKSVNGKLFELFSQEEIDNLQLDVRGAIKFLSSQKTVDPRRIGIMAAGVGSSPALAEAARNPSVQALALISGNLNDRARSYIKSRNDVPIMTVAGGDDKEGFLAMAEAHSLSKNKDSKFIQAHSGHGTSVFSRTEGLADNMMQWLADNVKAVGIETPISLNTEDGWTLHGRLRMPDGLADGQKFPAVAFSHGANHDMDTYEPLIKALVKKGIATVTYDRRGRNMDLNQTMPPAGTANDQNDMKAAINFLASQKSVDSNRIGIVGATAGNQPVFKAALGDARIKTIVCLTLENFTDPVKQFVTTMDIPVFFIASTEDLNTSRKPPDYPYLADNSKAAQAISKNKNTQLLIYDDAGRGSEMLKTKPELEGMIVRWFSEKLGVNRQN